MKYKQNSASILNLFFFSGDEYNILHIAVVFTKVLLLTMFYILPKELSQCPKLLFLFGDLSRTLPLTTVLIVSVSDE